LGQYQVALTNRGLKIFRTLRISPGLAAIASMVVMVVVLAAAGVAQAATPTPMDTNPTLSGTPTEGQTLMFSESWDQSDAGVMDTITDAWYDCPTQAITSSCTSIGAASGETYVLQSNDVNSYVYAVETATPSDGSPAGTADTTFVGPITSDAPVNTGLPSISGSAAENNTLGVSNGSWTNSPTSYTDTWERCSPTCSSVATGSSYTLGAADVGDTIELVVTASNGTSSAPATSQPTAVVAAAANVTAPVLSGTVGSGQMVSATAGTWNFTPTSYDYAWSTCPTTATCTAITSATTSSYTVASTDIGHALQVTVTAVGSAASPTAIATLLPPLPTYSAPPGFTGTAQAGDILTEKPAHWSNLNSASPPTIQWWRCDSTNSNCVAITSATGST
jgi:fibronectin-binding autotransporter adhesin